MTNGLTAGTSLPDPLHQLEAQDWVVSELLSHFSFPVDLIDRAQVSYG